MDLGFTLLTFMSAPPVRGLSSRSLPPGLSGFSLTRDRYIIRPELFSSLSPPGPLDSALLRSAYSVMRPE